MKKYMGKIREDGVGNGQAAWNALEKKYNSNTKEARRAYHEYLHLTQLSVLAGYGVGRDLYSVEQDGALPGGESLAGEVNHRSKRLQLGEFRKVASSNILSSQCRLAVNTWRHHSQDHCHSNTMDLRATK